MTALWRGRGGSETLLPPHSRWGRVLGAGAVSHGWRWREGSLAEGRLEWWTVGIKDQIFFVKLLHKSYVALTQHLVSDPGMCVYSILELSPGDSKHLLISCPDCLPVAASLCTSLYSVCVLEVQQQQDILERCFPRLKNPKHAVIFTDCAKKRFPSGWCLECTLYSSLSPIVSERVTYFVLDHIYTVQK